MVPATRVPLGAAAALAERLRVDGWAISVVSAFRELGIRVILLKGPAVARWLFSEDPWSRSYVDVDIFVAPADRQRADALLRGLGFTVRGNVLEVDENHARAFIRRADGASIDLHRTLHGMEGVPAELVWAMLTRDPGTTRIGSLQVEIPNAIVRTLNVALHLSPTDDPTSQPWADLQRAIDRIDLNSWRAAVGLARSLEIEDELAPRLRRLPDGAALADSLELTKEASERYSLSAAVAAGRASESVYSVSYLLELTDWRARTRYVLVKLFPPSAYLRQRWPRASRGPLGLFFVRSARVVACAGGLPYAIWRWWRCRR